MYNRITENMPWKHTHPYFNFLDLHMNQLTGIINIYTIKYGHHKARSKSDFHLVI